MHKPAVIQNVAFHDTRDYMKELGYIANYDREVLALVTLSPDRRIIKKRILTVGGFHSSNMDIELLFHRVIIDKAYHFIIAHNHPNGMGLFSEGDVHVSIRIMMVADLLGVPLYDHILFPYGRECCTSMRKVYPNLFKIDYIKIFDESIKKYFPRKAREA